MTIYKRKSSRRAILLALFIPLWSNGYADDITDSINEALQKYQKGDLTEAVESLNFASQAIQQKKGESLSSFLPQPLKGWDAKSGDSHAAGQAIFGGGVVSERQYNKAESNVTVQIVADSPMIQGVVMMLSNPMFATSDGGKLEKIKDQKAIVKFDTSNNRGEVKVVVNNRFLVSIEGRGIKEKELKAYAEAIDYAKMAKLP